MNKPEKVEALPCKSCGKLPRTFQFKDNDCGTLRYQIWCATEGCQNPVTIQTKTSKRDAIIFWNKAQNEVSHENPSM